MRISSKGRCAIAALAEMALDGTGGYITVATLARRLDVSKVYLEQVFSQLKRSNLVLSGKGASGGYVLRERPERITLHAVLSPIELHLSERAEKPSGGMSPELAAAVNELVLARLDEAIARTLASVTIADLAAEARSQKDGGHMYHI